MTVLPEKLAQYVDDARLAENAANYPEMQRELTIGQELAKTVVKEILLNLPLTHQSRAQADSIRESGLMPSKQRKEIDSRSKIYSYALDESLGLDEYAFMHWGGVDQDNSYGTTTVGINAKEVFYSPNTLASPYDLGQYVLGGLSEAYKWQNSESRAAIDRYFDSLVTGELWLEIIARRLLEQALHSSNHDVTIITSSEELGEIKYFGTVPPECIDSDYTDKQSKQAVAIEQYMGGLALPIAHFAIEESEEETEENKKLLPYYFATPEGMGVDPSTPRKLWSAIIEIANI